jgi:serine phosphatase RsbU (regulator of sigma subunit)
MRFSNSSPMTNHQQLISMAWPLFYEAVYAKSRCELWPPQDTLLLFTDGLFEAKGPNGEIYDNRRPAISCE